MTALQIITRTEGAHTIVELVGTLNLATSPDFTARLGELLRDGHRHLVVDVTGLRSCDRTGAQTVNCVRARVHAAGGTVELVCPDPEVAALLCSTSDTTRPVVHPGPSDALGTAASTLS
jgi:anti-sigma B factor antagonist